MLNASLMSFFFPLNSENLRIPVEGVGVEVGVVAVAVEVKP